MADPVLINGPRPIRARLDKAPDSSAAVLCCPPDPRSGGSRSDPRLQSITEGLTAAGIDCLRISYPEPLGEAQTPTDLLTAVEWLSERYLSVGVLGYSFGGALAIHLATVSSTDGVAAVCPPAKLFETIDLTETLRTVEIPGLICVGSSDRVVDSEALLAAAYDAELTVRELPTGHHLTGTTDQVTTAVVSFFTAELSPGDGD